MKLNEFHLWTCGLMQLHWNLRYRRQLKGRCHGDDLSSIGCGSCSGTVSGIECHQHQPQCPPDWYQILSQWQWVVFLPVYYQYGDPQNGCLWEREEERENAAKNMHKLHIMHMCWYNYSWLHSITWVYQSIYLLLRKTEQEWERERMYYVTPRGYSHSWSAVSETVCTF